MNSLTNDIIGAIGRYLSGNDLQECLKASKIFSPMAKTWKALTLIIKHLSHLNCFHKLQTYYPNLKIVKLVFNHLVKYQGCQYCHH